MNRPTVCYPGSLWEPVYWPSLAEKVEARRVRVVRVGILSVMMTLKMRRMYCSPLGWSIREAHRITEALHRPATREES